MMLYADATLQTLVHVIELKNFIYIHLIFLLLNSEHVCFLLFTFVDTLAHDLYIFSCPYIQYVLSRCSYVASLSLKIPMSMDFALTIFDLLVSKWDFKPLDVSKQASFDSHSVRGSSA